MNSYQVWKEAQQSERDAYTRWHNYINASCNSKIISKGDCNPVRVKAFAEFKAYENWRDSVRAVSKARQAMIVDSHTRETVWRQAS